MPIRLFTLRSTLRYRIVSHYALIKSFTRAINEIEFDHIHDLASLDPAILKFAIKHGRLTNLVGMLKGLGEYKRHSR